MPKNYVVLCCVVLCCFALLYVTLRYVMSCYVKMAAKHRHCVWALMPKKMCCAVLCCVALRYVMSCYVKMAAKHKALLMHLKYMYICTLLRAADRTATNMIIAKSASLRKQDNMPLDIFTGQQ